MRGGGAADSLLPELENPAGRKAGAGLQAGLRQAVNASVASPLAASSRILMPAKGAYQYVFYAEFVQDCFFIFLNIT